MKNQDKERTSTPFVFKLSPLQMLSLLAIVLFAGGVLNMVFKEPTAEAQLRASQVLAPIPPTWKELTYKQAMRESCKNYDAFELLRQGAVQLQYTDVGSFDAVCGKKAPVPTMKLVVEATPTQGKP